MTWCGSKKKNQNGFCSDLLSDPAAAVRPTRFEPDTPCVGVAKCSAGNREGRDAARARGSSLRNCTFWKEPSNHEFRVFVDEYLISNFMMSFLPPIADSPDEHSHVFHQMRPEELRGRAGLLVPARESSVSQVLA